MPSGNVTTQLPFPALVGLEIAQQAMILLAIEPRLRGLVISAPAGTGKSSLARGLHEILGFDNTPFIELPASIDAENLLGGLDLEATLHRGEIVMQSGLLAKAHGGFAHVDGINLVNDDTTNLMLAVMDSGVVQLEREGISLRFPAEFSLIGSYDPNEGQPRKHLLDRLGLIARLPDKQSIDNRIQVLQHNLLSQNQQWDEDTQFLRGLILTAREHLPYVEITESQIEQISSIAFAYGVEGHRADIFAVYTACAAAAAELRDSVSDEDITLAARLVILPRATRIPAPPEEAQQPPPPMDNEGDEQEADNPPDEQPPQEEMNEEDGEATSLPQELMAPPEQILEALESELPDTLEEMPFQNLRRGQTGSRGATDANRGRHVRSVQGDPRHGRIDIVATLRTAAPWQKLRQYTASTTDERRVYLDVSDIKVKKYRSKAGALFLFAVDASGSMALHRMRQAKGAVHTLLEKAYVKRDRVALIAFRGDVAEVLMPPTQSVELARRALDLLPTGGGTPLASAIVTACDVAQQAKMRGILQTVLILLTDGRGNIPLQEGSNPNTELQQLSGYVQHVGLRVIVVDTKRNYLSRGEARQLAEWLGGDYAYLPNASGEQIGNYIAEMSD